MRELEGPSQLGRIRGLVRLWVSDYANYILVNLIDLTCFRKVVGASEGL